MTPLNAVTYESRLPPLSSKPDIYKTKKGKSENPSSNFVVSRTPDGKVLSRYGDSVFWDLTPYQTTHQRSAKIYWDKLSIAHVEEAKWITFILVYMVSSGRATTLSVGSLINYHKVIKKLCLHADAKKKSIFQILGSDRLVCGFVKDRLDTLHNLHSFISLLRHLMILGEEKTKIKTLKSRTLSDLYQYQSEFDKAKQHPVIPPRIFSNYIDELWKVVNNFEQRKNRIVEFTKKCVLDPAYGRVFSKTEKREFLTDFQFAAKQYRLHQFFCGIGVTSVQRLQGYLFGVQDACRQLLFAYSGMRSDEMRSLSTDCLRKESGSDGCIVRLLGKTSKLIGQRKTTAWVTSIESERLIDVLKCIADLSTFNLELNEEQIPLFVSPSYLGFVGTKPDKDKYSLSTFNKRILRQFVDNERIRIEEPDLTFLETIDEARSWREEGNYRLGEVWSFSSHQYRRTLAYYCRQSGIVKLSTLKRQLKHISKEMSLYYASGSSYDGLFSTKDHFKQSYENNKTEADTLAYIFELILSDEKLYGGQGISIEESKKALSVDRISLQKRFEKGEISFRETALGACTTIDPCDKHLFGVISACLKCPSSVIKSSKLNRVIENQRNLTDSLELNSVEYRTETYELQSLLKFRKKINTEEQ